MDIFITVLICFLAGAAAGIGTGFAGMSAAAIIGPMLSSFLGVPIYQAIGIGLLSDVPASAISALTYKKHGNLDIKNSRILIVCVLITTAIGSVIAHYLPERTMNGSTQIALIILGLKFIIFPIKNTKEQINKSSENAKIKSAVGGTIVGLICGTIGAGGGMMLLFVLTSFLGYEMHMAVGTSVLIMAFTALTGGTSHLIIGGIPDILILLLCLIFTLIWARIAAIIANKVNAVTLNRITGIVIIVTSVAILAVNYLK